MGLLQTMAAMVGHVHSMGGLEPSGCFSGEAGEGGVAGGQDGQVGCPL